MFKRIETELERSDDAAAKVSSISGFQRRVCGRVLVLENDDDTFRAIEARLAERGYVAERTSREGLGGPLSEWPPDAIIVTSHDASWVAGLATLPRETALVVRPSGNMLEPAALEHVLDGIEDRRALAEARRVERDERAKIIERLRVGPGSSPGVQRMLHAVEQSAPTRATVLITGESGSGKECVAEAIHRLSDRRDAPFVPLHCASLADTLLESELFGHERGAFTGAFNRREGRFERAHGGTLFLDEIGEISPATQVKLLRVLQHRQFERVGGTQTLSVEVRIIAATNRDLREEVRCGRFREDLFYRLNVVGIEVPPLRERRDDIVPMAMSFLKRFARENGKDVRTFTPAALQRLELYPWPGNVRELENAVERAVVMSDGIQIDTQHLPLNVEPARTGVSLGGRTLAEIEREAILGAVDACGGSTARAAAMLGISVRKVQYRLQEYGLLTQRMLSMRPKYVDERVHDSGVLSSSEASSSNADRRGSSSRNTSRK